MIEKPTIELVFDPECPNVGRAREAIREALAAIGASPVWREWDRGDPGTPSALRELGSPRVLVNGRDVGTASGTLATADANSCRIYVDECGCLGGAPSAQVILDAIAKA
jgi:mercuric ion transport protein